MKTYLIEYESGRRTFKRTVETDDIEAYIRKNFAVGFCPRSRIFLCAAEIEKKPDGYHYAPRGEYWYCKVISLFESHLMKGISPRNSGIIR